MPGKKDKSAPQSRDVPEVGKGHIAITENVPPAQEPLHKLEVSEFPSQGTAQQFGTTSGGPTATEAVAKGISDTSQSAARGVSGATQGAADRADQAAQYVSDTARETAQQAYSSAQTTGQQLSSGMQQTGQQVSHTTGGIMQSVSDTVGNATRSAVNAGKELAEGAKNTLTGNRQGEGIIDKSSKVAKQAYDNGSQAAEQVRGKAYETVAPVVEPVKQTVAQTTQSAYDMTRPVVEPVQQTVNPIVQQLQQAAGQLFETAKQAPGRAYQATQDVVNYGLNMTRDVQLGAFDFVDDNVKWVAGTLQRAAQRASGIETAPAGVDEEVSDVLDHHAKHLALTAGMNAFQRAKQTRKSASFARRPEDVSSLLLQAVILAAAGAVATSDTLWWRTRQTVGWALGSSSHALFG